MRLPRCSSHVSLSGRPPAHVLKPPAARPARPPPSAHWPARPRRHPRHAQPRARPGRRPRAPPDPRSLARPLPRVPSSPPASPPGHRPREPENGPRESARAGRWWAGRQCRPGAPSPAGAGSIQTGPERLRNKYFWNTCYASGILLRRGIARENRNAFGYLPRAAGGLAGRQALIKS